MLYLDWSREGWRAYLTRPLVGHPTTAPEAYFSEDVSIPIASRAVHDIVDGKIVHGYIEIPMSFDDFVKAQGK